MTCDSRSMAASLSENAERFVSRLLARLKARADVRAVALVGSHAQGTARADSDVDLVVVTTDPAAYTERSDWLAGLCGAEIISTRRWGELTERRLVLTDGIEVDCGVVCPSWAETTPLDRGTARVARDGLVPLHDPDGILAAVLTAVAEE